MNADEKIEEMKGIKDKTPLLECCLPLATCEKKISMEGERQQLVLLPFKFTSIELRKTVKRVNKKEYYQRTCYWLVL